MSREQTKSIELREEVADAIEYFVGHGFIEEMTTDKKYYTKKLIEYAQESQREIMRLRHLLTNANTELFNIKNKRWIQNQNAVVHLHGWGMQTMGYVESAKNIANSPILKKNK